MMATIRTRWRHCNAAYQERKELSSFPSEFRSVNKTDRGINDEKDHAWKYEVRDHRRNCHIDDLGSFSYSTISFSTKRSAGTQSRGRVVGEGHTAQLHYRRAESDSRV